jgi:hypothetical protein
LKTIKPISLESLPTDKEKILTWPSSFIEKNSFSYNSGLLPLRFESHMESSKEKSSDWRYVKELCFSLIWHLPILCPMAARGSILPPLCCYGMDVILESLVMLKVYIIVDIT